MNYNRVGRSLENNINSNNNRCQGLDAPTIFRDLWSFYDYILLLFQSPRVLILTGWPGGVLCKIGTRCKDHLYVVDERLEVDSS